MFCSIIEVQSGSANAGRDTIYRTEHHPKAILKLSASRRYSPCAVEELHRLRADPQAPPLWARFYNIQTNTPIFCSRDGIPRKTLAEISHERRNGYSWLGSFARDLFAKDLPAWKKRLERNRK